VAAGEEREQVAEQYFVAFPKSRRFAETHGFSFWVLRPRRVRFIAGFGKNHWIEPAEWPSPT
jgi:hypothetical protein